MGRAMTWRVDKMCADCPFQSKGPGLHLRKSLQRDRWLEILSGLRIQGHFICHKTTDETGNGSDLVCAGAIEWQNKHKLSSQYVRICERLDAQKQARRNYDTRTEKVD